MDHPKPSSKSLDDGHALHVSVLEPGRFDGLFHIAPPLDGRSKEGKELLAYHTQLAADAKKTMLRQGLEADTKKLGQLENCRGMASSLRSSQSAKVFLDTQGQNEVSLLWKDAETGLMLKARMDRICEVAGYIVEIKSTRNAGAWSFGKDCLNYSYYVQAAHYISGIKAVTGIQYNHVILAVENFAPFDSKSWILDDAAISLGMVHRMEWLLRFAECKSKNSWPGYDDKFETLSLPKYAL